MFLLEAFTILQLYWFYTVFINSTVYQLVFLANLSQYFSLSLSKPTPSMCCISHILLTTDFHFSSDFHEKRIIILNLCLGIQMFSCQNYTSAIHKVHYCKLTTNYIVTLGRFLRTGNCYTSLLAKGPKHRVIF